MSPPDLLAALHRRGVLLSLTGSGDLQVRCRDGALTRDLRVELLQRKPEIVRILTRRSGAGYVRPSAHEAPARSSASAGGGCRLAGTIGGESEDQEGRWAGAELRPPPPLARIRSGPYSGFAVSAGAADPARAAHCAADARPWRANRAGRASFVDDDVPARGPRVRVCRRCGRVYSLKTWCPDCWPRHRYRDETEKPVEAEELPVPAKLIGRQDGPRRGGRRYGPSETQETSTKET